MIILFVLEAGVCFSKQGCTYMVSHTRAQPRRRHVMRQAISRLQQGQDRVQEEEEECWSARIRLLPKPHVC